MFHRTFTAVLISSISIATLLVAPSNTSVSACPFCQAVAPTLAEEMFTMDIVVIAELQLPDESAKDESEKADSEKSVAELARSGSTKSLFIIREVLKGDQFVKAGMEFKTVFFGKGKSGDKFLVMGTDPPEVFWTTPLSVEKVAIDYLKKLSALPEQGPKRMEFFLGYMEHENELLARDTYEEFARAPYEDVIALKSKIDRKQLVKWIGDQDIPASRKRLYFTMLGICGEEEDAALLEKMMQSEDRLMKASLDAMIACYLNLKGVDGLPLIEDLFLKNKKAEYSDTYATISALRFHGMETDVIPRKRLTESLRYMLDRPKHADLVIPDLARMEDWSVVDRLVKLFKDSDSKTSWVRLPVINYLRACPLPEAKVHLEELAQLDPKAMKQASTFFPLLSEEDDEDEDETESEKPDATADSATGEDTDDVEKSADKDSPDDVKSASPDATTSDLNTQSFKLKNPAGSSLSTSAESTIELPGVFDDRTSANNVGTNNVETQNSKSVVAKQEVSKKRTTVLRPVIDDADAQPVVAQNSTDDPAEPVVVSEIPLHQSILIGIVPLVIGALLFAFLWLVMSGRIDRIGF